MKVDRMAMVMAIWLACQQVFAATSGLIDNSVTNISETGEGSCHSEMSSKHTLDAEANALIASLETASSQPLASVISIAHDSSLQLDRPCCDFDCQCCLLACQGILTSDLHSFISATLPLRNNFYALTFPHKPSQSLFRPPIAPSNGIIASI